MVENLDRPNAQKPTEDLKELAPTNALMLARVISAVEQAKVRENGHLSNLRASLKRKIGDRHTPVIGITGTGGAGKSSLTDELILRMLHDLKDVHVAVICADPSRRKTGGALLGDRIRMNVIDHPRVYMRSMATRLSHTEMPEALADAVEVRLPVLILSSPRPPASARETQKSSTWWIFPFM
jgi:methylmalonyl-CoA mutase